VDGERSRALLPGELAAATTPAGVAIEGGSAADRRARNFRVYILRNGSFPQGMVPC